MNLRARRVLTLAVGTLLLLFLGLIYAYSVLMAPPKAQFDWSVSGMTLVFAISIVAFTIGNLLAGKIESAAASARSTFWARPCCWRASSGPRW